MSFYFLIVKVQKKQKGKEKGMQFIQHGDMWWILRTDEYLGLTKNGYFPARFSNIFRRISYKISSSINRRLEKSNKLDKAF